MRTNEHQLVFNHYSIDNTDAWMSVLLDFQMNESMALYPLQIGKVGQQKGFFQYLWDAIRDCLFPPLVSRQPRTIWHSSIGISRLQYLSDTRLIIKIAKNGFLKCE